MRVYYYKLYKELILISLDNVNLFYIIIINFITNILSTRNSYINKIYDIILVLNNILIKYITYIIKIKNLTVEGLINII